jgi:DNA-binding XRE family transcriptional regulator
MSRQNNASLSTKPLDRLARSAAMAHDYDLVGAQPPGQTEPERVFKKWNDGMARHFRLRFARQLKNLREQAQLSLHGLAEQAGVDHSQLVRLESAQRSCTLETAVKIAGALGVALGLLIAE